MQCDVEFSLPRSTVWPDWAIFESYHQPNFLQNQPKYLVPFVLFWRTLFSQNCCGHFLVNFWQPFISTSGHTVKPYLPIFNDKSCPNIDARVASTRPNSGPNFLPSVAPLARSTDPATSSRLIPSIRAPAGSAPSARRPRRRPTSALSSGAAESLITWVIFQKKKWAIPGLFFFIFVFSIHSWQYTNVRY